MQITIKTFAGKGETFAGKTVNTFAFAFAGNFEEISEISSFEEIFSKMEKVILIVEKRLFCFLKAFFLQNGIEAQPCLFKNILLFKTVS